MPRWIAPAAVALALLAGGCDAHQKQEDFADQASRAPAGYVSTVDGIEVTSDDPDDWRTAPLFLGKVRIDPAYPNPASTDVVTIPFSILDFDAVRGGLVLRAFDANRRFIRLDEEPQATQPGAYIFSFPAPLLGTKGLHRLYIFDAFGEIVSYGDLLLQ